MKRSLALSLLAALSGSTYASPTFSTSPTRSSVTNSPTVGAAELSENERIMLEIRKQVGSELKEQ